MKISLSMAKERDIQFKLIKSLFAESNKVFNVGGRTQAARVLQDCYFAEVAISKLDR